MVLDKKRKVLAAVLGAAVAVLIADRLLGVIPMGDGADEAHSADAALQQADPPRRPARTGPAPTLAHRIEQVVQAGETPTLDVRDAFRTPPCWNARASDPLSEADPVDVRARAFLQAHRLRATSVGLEGRVALVDDRCLATGQTLDGWRLLEVGSDFAAFASDDLRVTLRLPELAP